MTVDSGDPESSPNNGGTMRLLIFAAVLILGTNPVFGYECCLRTAGPAEVYQGVPFDFTVRATDELGNTETDWAGSVFFTSYDSDAVLPAEYTFVPSDMGVHTFSAMFPNKYSSGTIIVQSRSGRWAGFDTFVNFTTLTIDLAGSILRETPRLFVIRVEDFKHRQPVTGYRGTVHFQTDDPSIELPSDYTFTEADQGRHTFSVIFHRAGNRTLSIIDNEGNQDDAQTEITCAPYINVDAATIGLLCPTGGTVTLTATTNAANPTFVWRWEVSGSPPPVYGQTVTVNRPGVWSVQVIDGDTSCTAWAITRVQLDHNALVSAPETAYQEFTATIENDPFGPFTDTEWSLSVSGPPGANPPPFAEIVSGQGTPTIAIRTNASTWVVTSDVIATRVTTNCRQLGRNAQTRVQPTPISGVITTPWHVCPNATGLIASVEDAGLGASYVWSITNGVLLSGQGTRTIVYASRGWGSIQITVNITRDLVGYENSTSVLVGPVAAIVSDFVSVCLPDAAMLVASLTGTPPFRVLWSDGFEQNGLTSTTATHTVTPEESTSYTIIEASDAFCTAAGAGSAWVQAMDAPHIVQQPASQVIRHNQSAGLEVKTEGETPRFFWYQGATGDRSRLVSSGSALFKTPRLTRTTSYWVEIENDCGSEQSATAVITVEGSDRQRSVRH